MYNNSYMSNLDRINMQINELQKMRDQIQQPTPTNLTQNFQLAPTNREVIRYASSMDDVQRDAVIGDTPYFSKDMSVVWIKNTKGEIKTYELTEIIPKDNKDLKIEYLQAQIEELRKEMRKHEPHDVIDEPITKPTKSEEPADVSTISKSSKKSKWPKQDTEWYDKQVYTWAITTI